MSRRARPTRPPDTSTARALYIVKRVVMMCDFDTPAIRNASLKELEAFRHLYAHNYAGEADDVYFCHSPRHRRAPQLGFVSYA